MRYLSLEYGYNEPTVIALCENGITEQVMLSKSRMDLAEIVDALRAIQHDLRVKPLLPVAVCKSEPRLANDLYERGFKVLHLKVEVERCMDRNAGNEDQGERTGIKGYRKGLHMRGTWRQSY